MRRIWMRPSAFWKRPAAFSQPASRREHGLASGTQQTFVPMCSKANPENVCGPLPLVLILVAAVCSVPVRKLRQLCELLAYGADVCAEATCSPAFGLGRGTSRCSTAARRAEKSTAAPCCYSSITRI